MRASSLIYEILKGCGVSDNAAQAMETISEKLLENIDKEVYVEVNGSNDFIIDSVYLDGKKDVCIEIKIEKGELDC